MLGPSLRSKKKLRVHPRPPGGRKKVRRFGLGTFLIEHDCFTASLVMGCTLHCRARTSKQN